MKEKIKVVIVEDHQLIREAFVDMVNHLIGTKVVASFENGRDFMDHIQEIEFDVVLLDIKMPVLNGEDTLREMMEINPNYKVICLTQYESISTLEHVTHLGASGFLLKTVARETLENAIHRVHERGFYVNDLLTKGILSGNRSYLHRSKIIEDFTITKKEMEVLHLIAAGQNNNQIADKLSISPRTAGNHRNHLVDKFNATNSLNMVIKAIKSGVITMNEIPD